MVSQEIERVKDLILNSPSYIANEGICSALVEELSEAHRKVRNQHEFLANGGRATMYDMSSTLSAQRAIYQRPSRSITLSPSIIFSRMHGNLPINSDDKKVECEDDEEEV